LRSIGLVGSRWRIIHSAIFYAQNRLGCMG
jgi:hypothetical protein